MSKILLIDENIEDLRNLEEQLVYEGFEVVNTESPRKALTLISENNIKAIVTELSFEDTLSGVDFIKEIRKFNKEIPVLVISSEKKVQNKIYVLNAGADDYIEKPFSEEEVVARIKAHIRKVNILKGNFGIATIVHSSEGLSIGTIGKAKIYFDKMMVKIGNEEVFLTTKENSILQLLYKNRGKVVSRETMMKEIWGDDSFVTERVIDTNVVSIRKKIGDTGRKPKYIKTVFGVGYKLLEED